MSLGPYSSRRRDVYWWLFVEYGLPLLMWAAAFGCIVYLLLG